MCCSPGAQFLLSVFMWFDCLTMQGRLGKTEGKVLALMNFECVEDDLLEHLKGL